VDRRYLSSGIGKSLLEILSSQISHLRIPPTVSSKGGGGAGEARNTRLTRVDTLGDVLLFFRLPFSTMRADGFQSGICDGKEKEVN
jgi:hypothetical protein